MPTVESGARAGGGERSKRRSCVTLGAVLGVALAAAVTLDVALYQTVRRLFAASEGVRLDPFGEKRYEAERAAPPPPGPLVVLFGDSRAAMWSPPQPPPGYRVVNRGIGYQTTAQIALRVDEDVASLRPAVVVLEAGVNDLKTIAMFPERRAEIVSDCERNLARIVLRCTEAGSTVVLVSIFDIGDVPLWRRPFWSDDVSAAVVEVNAFLPRLAGPHVVLFDANAVVAAAARGRIVRAYQFDYLHLSPDGYAALNQRLEPLLIKLAK